MSKHASNSTIRVMILGSTGSIGRQTLEVISHLNTLAQSDPALKSYEIVGLSAGKDAQGLLKQARQWGVRELALCTGDAIELGEMTMRIGNAAACQLVEDVECDLVVGAIVGIAGLGSVYRAIELGIDVALANKETLVAGGALVMAAAKKSGARILPIDSEHAGVWQCLQSLSGNEHYYPPISTRQRDSISRVVLTASGGPFRDFVLETRSRQHATLKDALKHPNWSMGAKVTIDSATLMNKALELIEAHWLFGLESSQLDAVIHPQSIVHAMIECTDGSVMAQMGAPDMRSPIQLALCSPNRLSGCSKKLDVTKLSSLSFFEIDPHRFPAIGLAMSVIDAGGDAGAWLNAANESAVDAFMNQMIPFGMIDQVVAQVMSEHTVCAMNSLDDIYHADKQARACAQVVIAKFAGSKA